MPDNEYITGETAKHPEVEPSSIEDAYRGRIRKPRNLLIFVLAHDMHDGNNCGDEGPTDKRVGVD